MKLLKLVVIFLSSSAMATPIFNIVPREYVSPVAMSIGYSISTNLLKQESQSYKHYLLVGFSYLGWQPWSIGISAGMNYYSVGNDIPATQDNPSMEDIDLTVGRTFEINKSNDLDSSFTWTFPTSADAHQEQYNGGGTFDNLLLTQLNKYFTLINSFSLGFIAQTNEFSPVTNERNVVTFGSYMLGLKSEISHGLSLNLAAGMKVSNYTDGTSSLESSKLGTWTVGLNYKNKKFGAGLRYINGNYDDEGPARYFAQDTYTQKIGGKLSYEF